MKLKITRARSKTPICGEIALMSLGRKSLGSGPRVAPLESLRGKRPTECQQAWNLPYSTNGRLRLNRVVLGSLRGYSSSVAGATDWQSELILSVCMRQQRRLRFI